jgi:hypothetical protein
MTTMSSTRQAATKGARRASAIEACKVGRHRLTPTFRAGERLCTVCGVVFSCQACLEVHHLPPAQGKRVFPFPCEEHREAGVQS